MNNSLLCNLVLSRVQVSCRACALCLTEMWSFDNKVIFPQLYVLSLSLSPLPSPSPPSLSKVECEWQMSILSLGLFRATFWEILGPTHKARLRSLLGPHGKKKITHPRFRPVKSHKDEHADITRIQNKEKMSNT